MSDPQPELPVAWYRIPDGAAVPIFAWGDWPPPEPDDTVWHPLYTSPDGRPVEELDRLRAAMWKYGKHLSSCTIHTVRVPAFSCSCGWLKVRETLAGGALKPTERQQIRAALERIAVMGEQGMQPDYTRWLVFHIEVARIAREALGTAG